ncbi:MAG: hypothetical protein WA999_09565, partial [Spirulinaceae cyanobacterium]
MLDFWFGHPHQKINSLPIEERDNSHWQKAIVRLHPQLVTPVVEEDMVNSIAQFRPFMINQHLPITGKACLIDSTITVCLLPLLQLPQTIKALV